MYQNHNNYFIMFYRMCCYVMLYVVKDDTKLHKPILTKYLLVMRLYFFLRICDKTGNNIFFSGSQTSKIN